jgi:hypothetical protein
MLSKYLTLLSASLLLWSPVLAAPGPNAAMITPPPTNLPVDAVAAIRAAELRRRALEERGDGESGLEKRQLNCASYNFITCGTTCCLANQECYNDPLWGKSCRYS